MKSTPDGDRRPTINETINEESHMILPAGYDIVWFIVSATLLLLTVAALVSLGRAREVTGLPALIWLLAILVTPVLGAAAWFLLGSRRPVPAEVRTRREGARLTSLAGSGQDEGLRAQP